MVATGHLTDTPDRAVPRFPESAVDAVEARIEDRLARWGVGDGGLLICGGARGGDLLAASVAHRLGATVWLLLAHPPERFEQTSVLGADERWSELYWWLLARVPSWTLEIDEATRATDAVYERTNDWMLEVADRQAGPRGTLRLLAVWDGTGAVNQGGAADMAARAGKAGAIVEVVKPSV